MQGLTNLFLLASVLVGGTQAFKVGISHFNDISGQIQSFLEGTSNSSKAPTPCPDNQTTECIGGVISIAHHLYEPFDQEVTQNLTLSTGNVIGGESGWVPVKEGGKGWQDYAQLVRDHYKPDAVAFGMKEFGAGVARALDFAKKVGQDENRKIVTLCNTCLKNYDGTEGDFCANRADINIISLTDPDNNHVEFKIGVIGFTTPTVERLSIPGKLKFENVTENVKRVVNQNSNIKTFIAIGDGTLSMAKEILDNVPQVRLVAFGMGLSTSEDLLTEYPMKWKNGYIVTAGRYGSSIGRLVVDIDGTTGNFKSATGKMVKMVYPEPRNAAGNAASPTFNSWKSSVDEAIKDTVGHSRVTLEGGEICWKQECNLGNLMADAIVNCALQKPATPFKFPVHAVWHGGAFFEDKIIGGERISRFDMHKWLPYHNLAHLVKILGQDLWNVFAESVKGIDPSKAGVKQWRQFLQISNGMEVYISTLPDGAPKLTNMRMTHDKEGVPRLQNISLTDYYYLVIPTYLYEGRGVYDFTLGKWQDVKWDETANNNIGFDDACLETYIRALKHVSVGFEERIWINGNSNDRPPSSGDDCPSGNNSSKGASTGVTVILTIVFFSLFLAIIFVGFKYVLPRLRRDNNWREQYPANQL